MGQLARMELFVCSRIRTKFFCSKLFGVELEHALTQTEHVPCIFVDGDHSGNYRSESFQRVTGLQKVSQKVSVESV